MNEHLIHSVLMQQNNTQEMTRICNMKNLKSIMQSAKLNTKGHTLFDSIYVIQEREKPYTQRLPATRGGRERWSALGAQRIF